MDFWNSNCVNKILATESAIVLDTITTVLADYFNGNIISIEHSNETVSKFLDRKCGIDALVDCNDGSVFGIASRVRYRKYSDFAIRTIHKYNEDPNSDINVRTEIDHITHSGIKPRYHVNTCVLADGYYIAIAKTTDIVNYINNNYCKKYVNPKNGSEIKFVPYSAVNAVEIRIPKNTDCDDF